MMTYIYIGIAIVLIVYALNYVCYLNRRAKNTKLIQDSDKHDFLIHFKDEDNYLFFDMMISRDLDLYREKGFLPFWLVPWWLYLPRRPFRVAWKIDGHADFVMTDAPFLRPAYNADIKKIFLPLYDGIYFIDPFSGKKEKIKTGIKGQVGTRVSDDANFAFLTGPTDYEARSNPTFYCVCMDIRTQEYTKFDLPDRSHDVHMAQNGGYFVIVKNKLYQIKDSQTHLVKEFPHEVSYAGAWPGDNVILYYHENDLPRLSWDGVEIKFTHPRQLIEKAADYVWVVDFDGESYVLKTFDVSGQSQLVSRIKEKPKEMGNWQGQGVWVAYADGRVDVYTDKGLESTTQLEFKIGMGDMSY